MQIYCNDCKLYLGEVRDATLRKNIKHICSICYGGDFVSVPKDPSIKDDAALNQLKSILEMNK